jgi:hypothetical protein
LSFEDSSSKAYQLASLVCKEISAPCLHLLHLTMQLFFASTNLSYLVISLTKFIKTNSVDEVLGEGFSGRIVKRFSRRCRRRRLLYPWRTFPNLHVPTAHMFKDFCTHGVHFRFALDVEEGVATMPASIVFPLRQPLRH